MQTSHTIILETDRLILREFTIYDARFIVDLLNSPGWLEFIGDRNVRTEEQADNYLLNVPLRSYHENGFGLYMVELKSGNTPAGMCGLLKRDYLEHHDIGFAFLPEYTGKGYAFEIVSALISYAKQTLSIPTLLAITLPGNTKSIRLLERVGLQFVRMVVPPQGQEELMVFGSV
jgi:RimJ/RimL family protein N-acetyltransferase